MLSRYYVEVRSGERDQRPHELRSTWCPSGGAKKPRRVAFGLAEAILYHPDYVWQLQEPFIRPGCRVLGRLTAVPSHGQNPDPTRSDNPLQCLPADAHQEPATMADHLSDVGKYGKA